MKSWSIFLKELCSEGVHRTYWFLATEVWLWCRVRWLRKQCYSYNKNRPWCMNPHTVCFKPGVLSLWLKCLEACFCQHSVVKFSSPSFLIVVQSSMWGKPKILYVTRFWGWTVHRHEINTWYILTLKAGFRLLYPKSKKKQKKKTVLITLILVENDVCVLELPNPVNGSDYWSTATRTTHYYIFKYCWSSQENLNWMCHSWNFTWLLNPFLSCESSWV